MRCSAQTTAPKPAWILGVVRMATSANRDCCCTEELQDLRLRLAGAKARLRGAAEIDLQVASILERHHVVRYLVVKRTVREEHEYRQARRGRPGPETAYRKITKRRFGFE